MGARNFCGEGTLVVTFFVICISTSGYAKTYASVPMSAACCSEIAARHGRAEKSRIPDKTASNGPSLMGLSLLHGEAEPQHKGVQFKRAHERQVIAKSKINQIR